MVLLQNLKTINYEQNYLTESSYLERIQRCTRGKVPFLHLFRDRPVCSMFHRQSRFKLMAFENTSFESSKSSTSQLIAVNTCILTDWRIGAAQVTVYGGFLALYLVVGCFFFSFPERILPKLWLLLFLKLLGKCSYNFLTTVAQIYLNCFINRIQTCSSSCL